jgi:GNAT superfamily N-acetyltransferase
MESRSETVEVTKTYLQMISPGELIGAESPGEHVRVERVIECPSSFYRYLYSEVGRNYHWIDRSNWSDDEIRSHLDRPEVSLWVVYSSGAPAGYFELEQHSDGSIEVAYFGLVREFIGRGLGKYLLTYAVSKAWEAGANRVWLHTCTLDDPAAMPNYLKRGFKPFKSETYVTTRG